MISTFRQHRSRFGHGPNLTPLVDVCLVVLIFLMLAGSFGGATHFFAGRVGEASSRSKSYAGALAAIDLFIEPSSDGTIMVRGNELPASSDLVLLRQRLRLKSDQLTAGGVDCSNVPVVLHPARLVRYGQLMAVYDAVEGARFSSIAMAEAK